MEENQVTQQNFPSFPLFSWYTGYTRECIGGVCPIHGQCTGVCSGRVCVPVFPSSPVHGSYTGVCWACVPYTVSVHGRVWLGVCLSFSSLLCTRSIQGRVLGVCLPYTVHTRACMLGVCPCVFPLISYTVSVHGRVSQPCASLVFQNLLFTFLWLQFVLFLVSFHQIVSNSFINHHDWSQTQEMLAWESLLARDILDATSKANHDLSHGRD